MKDALWAAQTIADRDEDRGCDCPACLARNQRIIQEAIDEALMAERCRADVADFFEGKDK